MRSDFWTSDGRARPGTNDLPIFFRRAFWDCAVVSFAVRVASWLDSSDTVFMIRETEVLSDCVAVVRFASARLWSCCILVKISALACAECMSAAYPLVFEVLDGF